VVLDAADGLAGTGKEGAGVLHAVVASRYSSRLQRLSRAEGSMAMAKILPREFGVLLVCEVKSDLVGLALNHHVENLPVLGHLYPTGAGRNRSTLHRY
jgi:hypothetical protein